MIADGQKIAKKLCTQITKETKRVKALLDEYRACHVVDPSLCELSLSQALDPIFVRTLLTSLSDVATAVTAEKLEAIQAYLMVSRSREEVAMLREDAKNVVSYYNRKKHAIQLAISSLEANSDPYSRGSITLLHFLLKNVDHLLDQASLTLHRMNSQSQGCVEFIEDEDEAEDDSCASDSSYDSD